MISVRGSVREAECESKGGQINFHRDISMARPHLIILLIIFAVAISVVTANASPLDTAKTLAKSQYAGWTYGENAATKQVDCVQFLAAVVSKEIGRDLNEDERNAKPPANLIAAVSSQTPVTKGVQQAVVDVIKKGDAIEPKDAQVGDLMQYWMKNAMGAGLAILP
jgi:hypothetical protein